MNKAYLKSESSPASDECLTPLYGVEPIVKYLIARGYVNIWCPFDNADSMFSRLLYRKGFNVDYSHLDMGLDFFDTEPPPYTQCIVSNPPFSKKDAILERLYDIGLPFAMILPQNSLQSIKRVDMYMKHGLEYLGFDRRINYYTRGELDAWKPANHFASGYFCKDVLPEKMLFEKLEPVQEGYYEF